MIDWPRLARKSRARPTENSADIPPIPPMPSGLTVADFTLSMNVFMERDKSVLGGLSQSIRRRYATQERCMRRLDDTRIELFQAL
jgi:hypothetical protein